MSAVAAFFYEYCVSRLSKKVWANRNNTVQLLIMCIRKLSGTKSPIELRDLMGTRPKDKFLQALEKSGRQFLFRKLTNFRSVVKI